MEVFESEIKRKGDERKQRHKEKKKNQNSIYELYIDSGTSI